MIRKIRIIVWIFLLCLGLLYGLFVPVRLSVRCLKSKVYETETLHVKDFSISGVSLFGVPRKLKKHCIVTAKNGNREVTVYSGKMTGTCVLSPEKPAFLTLNVSGTCYAGQMLKKEQVQVQASYEDGTVLDVSSVDLPDKPFSAGKKKQTVTVSTVAGNVSSEVPVMLPVRMSAVYAEDVVEGSYFNVHKVSVLLYYKDDTSVKISDFAVHNQNEVDGQSLLYSDFADGKVTSLFPERLDSDVDLYVISPYGTTGLSIHPKKEASLKASYDGKVYQCEKMSADHLQVTVEINGKTEHVDVKKNCSYNEDLYMVSPTDIVIPTVYGDVSLQVKPIMVKKVKISADTPVGGQKPVIQNIVLVYEDGHKTKLKSDDVTWLNLPDVWSDGDQVLWFSYHGYDFSGQVNAVSGLAVQFREGLSQGQGYRVSDKDLETVSLICQRVGNNHMQINVREVAVMLNRYDRQKQDDEGFLDYIYRDGYWGDKSSIMLSIEDSLVNPDVFALVQDAVVNGYRSLPAYVTERVFENEIKEKNTSDYEQDGTELITSDGRKLRFYEKSDEDDSLLYCYDADVYEQVVGHRPPDAIPVQPAVQDTNEPGIVVDDTE